MDSILYKGWRLFAPTLQRGGELQSERHTASGVRVVILDGRQEKDLPIRHDLCMKSQEFNWGYGGSGPAQLALALCAHVLGDDTALEVFQDFKREWVAGWGSEWEITSDEIEEWYRNLQKL